MDLRNCVYQYNLIHSITKVYDAVIRGSGSVFPRASVASIDSEAWVGGDGEPWLWTGSSRAVFVLGDGRGSSWYEEMPVTLLRTLNTSRLREEIHDLKE